MKFKSGDIVAECGPFAHCIKNEVKDIRCHYCLEDRSPLKSCAGCKVARYCGRDCQAKDWKEVHRMECIILKRDSMKSTPELFISDHLRLLVRVILILNKYPERASKMIETFSGKKNFNSLQSHVDEIFGKPNGMADSHVAWLVFNSGFRFPIEFYQEIYGKVAINSHGIMFGNTLVGSGLYIDTSFFDHSCSPNCIQTFDGIKMQIRALKDIDTDHEVPYITYVGPLLSKAGRQSLLMRDHYFQCACSRCSNPDQSSDIDLIKMKKEFENLIQQRKFSKAFETGLKCFEHALRVLPILFPALLGLFQILRACLLALKSDPKFPKYSSQFNHYSAKILNENPFLLEYHRINPKSSIIQSYGKVE